MRTNDLKKVLAAAILVALVAPLAASARPPQQRPAPQVGPNRAERCGMDSRPAPHGRHDFRPPHGHRPQGYASWYWAPPPPPPPPPPVWWAYPPPPPPPPPPPAYYYYRPGWSVSFSF